MRTALPMSRPTGRPGGWLDPVLPAIPEVTDLDAKRLQGFGDTLSVLLADHPIDPAVTQPLRGQRIQRIRRELAERGHLTLAVPASDGGLAGPRYFRF